MGRAIASALVGRNGVGKSTLLKIIAGKLSPTTGSISQNGFVYYLPQISTIRQEIFADTILTFLSYLTEEWWKIEEILAAKFSTKLDLSLPPTIQGANLLVSNRLLIQNNNLHVSVGDRVAIAGANGSGKSSLVKAILGMENPAFLESGEVLLATSLKAVYLDQSYELVNREQTILENMQAANPNLSYQLLRQQLGHFLFKITWCSFKLSH